MEKSMISNPFLSRREPLVVQNLPKYRSSMKKNVSLLKEKAMKTMRRFLHVLALFAFLFSANSAYAEFPLSMYAEVKDYKPFKDYITGVGRGIFWANVVIEAQGRPPLFCIQGSWLLMKV